MKSRAVYIICAGVGRCSLDNLLGVAYTKEEAIGIVDRLNDGGSGEYRVMLVELPESREGLDAFNRLLEISGIEPLKVDSE